jgi:hypothetical protein
MLTSPLLHYLAWIAAAIFFGLLLFAVMQERQRKARGPVLPPPVHIPPGAAVLEAAGRHKIAVIKAMREVRPDLSLRDAKDFVESAPQIVETSPTPAQAEAIRKALEAAGASVRIER